MNVSRLIRNGKTILAYEPEHDPITFESVRNRFAPTVFESVTHDAVTRLAGESRPTVDSNGWQHAGPPHSQNAVETDVFGGATVDEVLNP